MTEVENPPLDNPPIHFKNSVNSGLSQPAYESNRVSNPRAKEQKEVEKPHEVENSRFDIRTIEVKNSPDSNPPSEGPELDLTSNSTATEQEGEKKHEVENSRLDNGTIPANNSPNSNLHPQEQQLDLSSSSADKKQEEGEKPPEVESIHLDNPVLHAKNSPSSNPLLQGPNLGLSSSPAANEQKEGSKKGAKKAKFCCCFGQPDREQHHESFPVRQGEIPVTTQNMASAKEENPIPRPNRSAPFVPFPSRSAPPAPAPIRQAPPVPELPSTRKTSSAASSLGPKDAPASATPSGQYIPPFNSVSLSHGKARINGFPSNEPQQPPITPVQAPMISAQKALYPRLLKNFIPTEAGSELKRDSAVLREEDEEVKKLENAVYNQNNNYWKTPFEGDDEQDKSYQKWAKDNFKKREVLKDLIEKTKGLGRASREGLWYVEYVKVRQGTRGPPWKNMVLVGFNTKEEIDKFNEELQKDKTDTWFLAGFEIRAEIGIDVRPCAIGSDSGTLRQDPIGTPIFSQNLQSVSTLCGVLCHIRGSDNLADAFCTIGGVLHINQEFFVLTSAHPFQDKVASAREIDIASEVLVGNLFSYKFGNTTLEDSKAIGLVSDWALISLENEYIKPNSVSLKGSELSIPISGYLPTTELKVGKVWVCSSRGPQLGVLVRNPTIMGMGGKVFETRGIRLVNELVSGDSGSWVVRNGKLCGFIISRTVGEAWAYMLPIEQVFEDIHEHLESIWKSEVSIPQTWLGGPMLNITPENHPPVQDLDNGLLVHKNGERQSKPLQDEGSVSARSDEKPTDLAAAQAEIRLVSQPSPPGQSSTADHQSDHAGPVFTKQISVQESPSPQEGQPSQAKLPDPPLPTYVRAPSRFRNPDLPPVPLGPVRSRIVARDNIPIGPTAKLVQEPQAAKDSTASKKDGKQSGIKEEQRKEERKEGSMKSEPGKEERPKEERLVRHEASPILSLDDNLRRTLLPRFSYILDPPGVINATMPRVSHLLQAGHDIRANKTAQDIVLEIVVFNDLMSQLLNPVASIDITASKDETQDGWWSDPKWLQNLTINASPTKTELILDILSDEIKMIRHVVKTEKFILSPVFSAPVWKLFLAQPIVGELASNNQRLKRLVEGRPTVTNYYNNSITNMSTNNNSSHNQLMHRPAPDKLPAKKIGMVYDCTKQLELYKALKLHHGFPPGVSVGLAVPKFWVHGGHDNISDAPVFVLLQAPEKVENSEYLKFDERSETAKRFRSLQWWAMEPKPDEEVVKNKKNHEASYVFNVFSPKIFTSSIYGLDGIVQHVVFKPLLEEQSQELATFKDIIKSDRLSIPRRTILKMALGLSVGMIFLSPTPWHEDDLDNLWNKVLFLLGKNRSLEELVFVPSPHSWDKGRIHSGDLTLFKLGHALIVLALKEELEGEEYPETLDSFRLLRSGLVALKMGVEYQDIVKICLSQKYENSSGVKNIDESSTSFREHANEAIIVPLRVLWFNAEEPRLSVSV